MLFLSPFPFQGKGADRRIGAVFPLRWLASVGRRRALFFILDNKEANNQGLELMSDKIVKALFRQHKHPMKDRAKCAALGSGDLKGLWLKL